MTGRNVYPTVENQESNIDRLLKARAEIDEKLRRHKSAFTVLFTDVVGSTAYFDRYGDTAGFAMLHRHSDLAGGVFEEFQGRVIKTIGDSVMAEFPEPAPAVHAAVELQRRLFRANQALPERDRLQIRIGINSGVGFRASSDVYGDVVNLAARITKRTGPAQILISHGVRDAVAGEPDLHCAWLGKVTLAGKTEKEDIYEVVWTDTGTYSELRRNLTDAFARGELMAPGVRADDFLQPGEPASASIPPPFPTIARYEILSEVGAGGMGIVYKARDRETQELVALKVLKPEIAADAAVMERFKNELRLARKVTHKNVCRIHDYGRTETSAYISMEFVDGENLRAILGRFGGLPLRKGTDLAHQICAGLREAHAQGIVHRDLKPENIMVDRAGGVKVMDFGIARSMEMHGRTTGSVIGTPAYMAPEQAEGKTIDQRTDVYALGLILYEMFTGRPAFAGDTPVALALKQIRDIPRPPRELDPGLPEPVEGAILRCLEKNPAERFQSVAELDAALAGDVVEAPSPSRRKRRLVWALAAVSLVVALVVALIWLLPLRQSHAPPQEATATKPAEKPAAAPDTLEGVAKELVAMGDEFYQGAEYQRAIRAYERALKIDPNNKAAQEGVWKSRGAMDAEKGIGRKR